jgi:PAS domain S-box-containing protein
MEHLKKMLPQTEFPVLDLLHQSKTGVIIADGAGRIASWNLGAIVLFQYTKEKVLGKSLTILMPERFKAAHLLAVDRIINGTLEPKIINQTMNVFGKRKDETEFPCRVSVVCHVDAERTCFIGLVDEANVVMDVDLQNKFTMYFMDNNSESQNKLIGELE